MSFIRFSLRRLMILTALVAVLLYVLILRPTAVAKNFAHEMEVAATTDFKSLSQQYFQGMRTDGANLEFQLKPRSATDVLRCRQAFSVNMVRPTGKKDIASVYDFYATPIGVYELRGPFMISQSRK